MNFNASLSVVLRTVVAASLATVSVLAQVQPEGLVSLWAAEGNGSDSVSTNHGLLRGGVTFAPGIVGQAFVFDGATGYVEVPDSPGLDLQAEATLMAWVWLDELPAQAGHVMHVMGKSQVSNDLDLQVEGDSRMHFYIGAGLSVASTTVLRTGVWYHVTATYAAANRIDLFLNGVREASAPIAIARAANVNPLTMGWNAVFPGRFLLGRMDQVRVSEVAVPADGIEAVYAAESGLIRARIYTAAEVCWPSVSNAVYQVQWAPSLDAVEWHNLGAPTQGTGESLGLLDSTRGQAKKFYRIQLVQ